MGRDLTLPRRFDRFEAVFLEPEVWVEALGNRYEETIQDVATGEFHTKESREEMLERDPPVR